MSVEDLNAERERIRKEIEALEKSLDPTDASIEVVVSDSNAELDSETEEDFGDEDSDASDVTDEERGKEKSDDEIDRNLPASLELCLQVNLVYQEVIQEKLQEVTLLLSQNKQRQEDILWQLSGPRIAKNKSDDPFKAHVFIGRFMKPYFKDKATGCGPSANQDTREKAAQGIKSFQELNVAKWKTKEKELLKDSVLSDSLQHLLQPKMFKHEYLTQKLEKVKDEMNQQIVEKQIREALREIEDINQLSEERLVGQRNDEHDWEKISNIHFEGTRSASELRKFWQNSEHPGINKAEWSEEEVQSLKAVASKHNFVDWQSIANELGTHRTAFQCLQKYQKYNKDFKKREWTKEEDQMLTHLVEQMRVGIHVPYQKIAYYMEGRDTFQLIYRWTKSVDPKLKKGPWTPEEDAKLLSAVSVYGERDWYKIREEVQGRSDSQCRDRYRKALNKRVKKGRWSQTEKEHFLELIDKYGVGHWAKIASELPNRTDSQCLNKWKAIAGYRTYHKKKRLKDQDEENIILSENSEEDISSESSTDEEMEIEFMDSSEDEPEPVKVTRRPPYSVPAIDLWVPTRDETLERRHKFITALSISRSAQSSSRNSKELAAKDATPASHKNDGHSLDEGNKLVEDALWCFNTVLKGYGSSYVTDVTTEDPAQMLKEACENGKYVFSVNLADVRKVLKRNTSFQRTKRMEKQRLGICPGMSQILPSMSVDDVRDVLQSATEKRTHQNMTGLQTRTIDRKLLMAVTPWVGNVIVIYSLRPASSLRSGTKADGIKEQVQTIKLSSTPVFTLLLQLFKIDADGCLQVIRERKSKESEVLKVMATKPQSAVQQPNSLQTPMGHAAQCYPLRGNSAPPGSLPNTSNALPGLQTSRGNTASMGFRMHAPGSLRRSTRVPKEKPKTVWELLREKRMKNSPSPASAAPCEKVLATGPKVVTPQLLITLQPEQGSSQPHALSSPRNPIPSKHTAQVPLLPLPPSAASSISPASSSLPKRQPRSEDGSTSTQETSVGSQNCGIHNKGEHIPISSNASAPHRGRPSGTSFQTMAGNSLKSQSLHNQSGMSCPVPHAAPSTKGIAQTTPNAATVASETKASISAAGSSFPIYSQQSFLSLLPAVLPSQGGPQNLANKLMAFTLVVTPQGLVSVPVHTLLGFSNSSQQAALPIAELNAPLGSLLPLSSISDNKMSVERQLLSVTNANTNVRSSSSLPISQVTAPSIKSVKQEVTELKCPSDILPSASAVPVLGGSLDSPSISKSFTSGELAAASHSKSGGPLFRARLPPANKPTIITNAELQSALSLISLSKGGVTELEVSSSAQRETPTIVKKRPLVQTFSDTVVQAPKRPLTMVTRNMMCNSKAEGVQCPVVARSLATTLIASNSINRTYPPFTIASSQTPATLPVASKNMNQICPIVSIAVRNPATQLVASTNMTRNLPLMSTAVRSPATPVFFNANSNQIRLPKPFPAPSLSSIAKIQNHPPISGLAKRSPAPPMASNSMNQIRPCISATTRCSVPATLLVASSENNQIQPPESIVPNPAKTHMASDDKNKSLPVVSVAMRNPPTQVLFSNKNQIQLPVSFALRRRVTPAISGTDKGYIQPPVSIAARSIATAPVPCNDRNQIEPPLSVDVSTLATSVVSSKDQNQICPPVSTSAMYATTSAVSSNILSHPPLSLTTRNPATPPVASDGMSSVHPPVSIAAMSATTPPVFSTAKNQIHPPVSVAARTTATPPVSATDKSKTQPPVSSTEKRNLDLSIVSIEEEGKVKSWLKGERGVHMPPLKDDLAYMPPSTCNLKTLSRLLQQKNVLEKNAFRLLPSYEKFKDRTTDEQLQVVQELVAHKFKDNPAYLLLKARFLSAFTMPAFLATLAPPKIRTTVRSTHYTYGDSDDEVDDDEVVEYDEMDSTDDERKEAKCRKGYPDNRVAKLQVDNTTERLPAAPCAAQPEQETLAEASCSQAAPDDTVVSAESIKVQTRRSARLRKGL